MPTERNPVPSVVKRNTLYLAASQALFMCVGQAAFILAALVVLALTGSATLAGLATAVIWGGRVLIVYQTGTLMDRIGRKAVLLLGAGLASSAVFVMGLAVLLRSLELFWVGLVVYGFGTGAAQQSRIAVADMYPMERRGEGIGYLMTGYVVGSLLSPVFTAAMTPIAAHFSIDVYGMILLASTPILAASSVLIVAVKPDPGEIARNLKVYYPGLTSNEANVNNRLQGSSLLRLMLFFPILAAFVASAAATGDMAMMMSLVSVIMHEHDIALTLISVAVTLHVVGMYGPSIPLGRLSDTIGRKWVTLLGGLVMAVGAFLTPLTSNYAIITFAIFLVGFGWSAANVATTALISDVTPPQRRGRLLGANDVAIGLAALSLPVLGGAVISNHGLFSLGLLGLVVAIPGLLIALPLREVSPGNYADKVAVPSDLAKAVSD